MQYKVREKFSKKVDCYLLVVCAESIILCLVGTVLLAFVGAWYQLGGYHLASFCRRSVQVWRRDFMLDVTVINLTKQR